MEIELNKTDKFEDGKYYLVILHRFPDDEFLVRVEMYSDGSGFTFAVTGNETPIELEECKAVYGPLPDFKRNDS